MIVLSYLGSQCTKFMQLDGHADFIRPFIWSYVSGLTRLRGGSDKGTASNFMQISEKGDGDPGNN
jgi:hypothetical protein